ncbi:DNA repair protein RadA [Kitasatospora sp. NBC_01266]|nr:AAA family ATPase [Kitasatospora sp. NBC_01266]
MNGEWGAQPGQTNLADHGGAVYAVQDGSLTVNNGVSRLPAHQLFDQWESSVRRGNRRMLRIAPDRTAALERTEPLRRLTDALGAVSPGQVLLVRGEPGVGKTALTLQAADQLRARSVRVLVAALPTLSVHAGGLGELLAEAAPPGTPAMPPGLLILDAAEAVQEGLDALCAEAVTAAWAATLTPVLISRDDAVDSVRDVVEQLGGRDIGDCTVPPLDDHEISDLLALAPELSRLARDPRARWLLRRLSVVDLLLRSAARGTDLPAVLSSEADVYSHVWLGLVLNNSRTVRGIVPEDRESALISLAEGRLSGRRVPLLPGSALAVLRSDGILAPLGAASPTSCEEHAFAHDVVRDFATVRRLVLTDGLPLLEEHGPRWALRAARIYCQARLWPGGGSTGTFALGWAQVHGEMTRLAARHGSRWEEVCWEAVLSAGWCADALAALTERLLHEPDLLRQLKFPPDLGQRVLTLRGVKSCCSLARVSSGVRYPNSGCLRSLVRLYSTSMKRKTSARAASRLSQTVVPISAFSKPKKLSAAALS